MKSFIIIMAVFWSLIAVAITGFVSYQVAAEPEVSLFQGGVGTNQKDNQVYLDKTFSPKSLDTIALDLSSEYIHFYTADTEDIRIVQKGWGLEQSQIIEAEASGNRLFIGGKAINFQSSFFSISRSEVEVYLPKGFVPVMDIQLSSGSLLFNNDFAFSDLTVVLSSGSIRSQGTISTQSANLKVTSGSIRLDRLEAPSFALTSSSGNIGLSSLSGGGKIAVTSGSVRVEELKMLGDIAVGASSGNVQLNLAGDPSFHFTGQMSSGSIKTYFPLTYEDSNKRHSSATVGSKPSYTLTTKVTSGSIRIQQD